MILEFDYFKSRLNSKLFESSYSNLLNKIAESPERYIGIFRPTKPTTKLIQNITQSHEIRFGDALEDIFEKYFEKLGFQLIQKRFRIENGEELSIDQLFRKDGTVFLIEQKVRDDHDSTKKKGQFDNFVNKYEAVQARNCDCEIVPIMWFIDDSLVKNRCFYTHEMEKMALDYQCKPYLFYGDKLFAENDGIKEFPIGMWNEIIEYLERWKQDLPDMPEINFDRNAEVVFDELKDLRTNVFRKLFDNQEIIEQIFPIIFPEGTVLKMLKAYFISKSKHAIYKTLAKRIPIDDNEYPAYLPLTTTVSFAAEPDNRFLSIGL